MNARTLLAATTLALALLVPHGAAAGDSPGTGDVATRRREDPPWWLDPRDHRDPLVPLLRRISDYFHAHEVDGVTLDARVVLNRTEAIRLSVISQLLGYTELYKVLPLEPIRIDIVERADYLVANLADVLSGGPFDGMAGLSLLQAYEATGDSTYLDEGRTVVSRLLALPSWDTVLNGGLMAAMAMAKYAQLTGDGPSATRAHAIVAGEVPYQRADGSFPHWCDCTKDVHYTDWMGMELILLERMMSDPAIGPMLANVHGFIEARIDSTGDTRYEEPCPDYPGCTVYYSSLLSGCSIDTETRGFTNEWGYSALLFDRFGSPRYRTVMNFMIAHEARGTFADKWAYFAPPDDPYYDWSSADTSVVNMSVMFWSLASILSARPDAAAELERWGPEVAPPGPARAASSVPGASAVATPLPPGRRPAPYARPVSGISPANVCDTAPIAGAGRGPGGGEPSACRLGPIFPNPARDGCEIRYSAPADAAVSLAVYDAGGRLVRRLDAGVPAAGDRVARWDRRDARGNPCRGGLYFVRLTSGSNLRAARVLVVP